MENIKLVALHCLCADVFDGSDEIRPGGEALNFAAHASAFDNMQITLLGAVGDDEYGRAVLKSVADKPIDVSRVRIDSHQPTAHNITYLTPEGDRYYKQDSWHGDILENYVLNEEEREAIAGADLVFIHFFASCFQQLLELKKEHGFKLAVDFDIYRDFEGMKKLAPYIDFFMISGEEQLLPYFRTFSLESDNYFNMSLGEKGSVTYHKGKEYRVLAEPVREIVDTTGCGDSYHAGFVCSLMSGADIETAMHTGSKLAAGTLSHYGGFKKTRLPGLRDFLVYSNQIQSMEGEAMEQKFLLNRENLNFSCGGVDLNPFSDTYPAGHQSGLTLIMHDRRMANGGDLRLEHTPGQWQPSSVLDSRELDEAEGSVTASLHYPDKKTHLRGFNPLIYPNLELDYSVKCYPKDRGLQIELTVHKAIPSQLQGKACFSLEIVPAHVIGGHWIMDGQTGIFPAQPNGPTEARKANIDLLGVYDPADGKADVKDLIGDREYYSPMAADDIISKPYATGHSFTVLPDSELYCFTVKSSELPISLYDGRMNHNNGWFVLAAELPTEKTGKLLEWYIEPRVKEDWSYKPVVQLSQVGYYPSQPKVAVFESDKSDDFEADALLYRIGEHGAKPVLKRRPKQWGEWLRYNYAKLDFSEITEEGLYKICYKGSESAVFRIAHDVYGRGVWQPVLEYFLPVQMCHMQVREKYRIWHGLCHMDDAVMAPTDYNHFDGYYQGPDTLCKYKPGDHIPGLNQGGWHDAGDYDLRIESQAGEVYFLALAYEEFKAYSDSCSIDQTKHLVEIHRPDGKNDLLEQIEHGLLSILGGYEALGRLYRGIICRDLRQYVLLGDGSNMTDGVESEDDRWVFTEDNPQREFTVAAQLACAYRSMKEFNPVLAEKALKVANELYSVTREEGNEAAKLHAAVELYLACKEEKFRRYILEKTDVIAANPARLGWIAARVYGKLEDTAFDACLREFARASYVKIREDCAQNPYGVMFKPRAWGAGWEVQGFAARYYFLHKAFPDICEPDIIYNSLNFVLGCHHGSNTASYASGVGAKSATSAYCANRADHTYIPGGVIAGTELISPNFPELLENSLIWQQGEYVLGGGSSHYMFLVLAVAAMFGAEDDSKG